MENSSLSFKSMYNNAIVRYNNNFDFSQNKKMHKYALKIIKTHKKVYEILSFLLKFSFNNEQYPDEQCVYYINDKYFAIDILDNENENFNVESDESKFADAVIDDVITDISKDVKEIDFSIDLLPKIKSILRLYIETIVDLVSMYNLPYDTDDHILHSQLENFLKYALDASSTINDLKRISDEVFLTNMSEKIC